MLVLLGQEMGDEHKRRSLSRPRKSKFPRATSKLISSPELFEPIEVSESEHESQADGAGEGVEDDSDLPGDLLSSDASCDNDGD